MKYRSTELWIKDNLFFYGTNIPFVITNQSKLVIITYSKYICKSIDS